MHYLALFVKSRNEGLLSRNIHDYESAFGNDRRLEAWLPGRERRGSTGTKEGRARRIGLSLVADCTAASMRLLHYSQGSSAAAFSPTHPMNYRGNCLQELSGSDSAALMVRSLSTLTLGTIFSYSSPQT